MKIAVIGSWKADSRPSMLRTHDEFASACEDIGRELAKQGQIVIVGSDSQSTADHYVVKGMLSVIAATQNCSCRIDIIRDSSGNQPYYEFARQFPKHISYPPISGVRWSEAHLMQIKEADAVLTIGGSSGTYQAGLAAFIAQKVFVPIGTFGGASLRLASELRWNSEAQKTQLATLASPWSEHVLDTAADLLGIHRKPRILIIHGRSDDRYKLTEWLRATLKLEEILVMQQEFGGGTSLPEKFEQIAAKADGAIALATPDDFVTSADGNATSHRARQNVWLEVGWIWGRLGRKKVMLLTKGKLEHPSDIQGLEYYSYESTPIETSESIRKFIAGLLRQSDA